MSPASSPDLSALRESSRPDQRLHRRYPIALDLRYKLENERHITHSGSGRTLNLSSGGIFFKPKEPVPERGQIELVVNWPFLLDGACHLHLIARGRIVRSNDNGTAVEVTHHELRTGKRPLTAS
jgi:hypothetical protein